MLKRYERITLVAYVKKQFRKLQIRLKEFKRGLVAKLLQRGDISKDGSYRYDAIANFGKVSQDNPNGTMRGLLNKFKNQIFTHRQNNLTERANKSNLTMKEKVTLFAANKLTKQRAFQKETRIYRDKQTKKVTVVDSVKEVK